MNNNSRKAKSRYLQNIVRQKIINLFKLNPDDKEHRANLINLTEGELGELADQHYPGNYKEHEMLDYRMKTY